MNIKLHTAMKNGFKKHLIWVIGIGIVVTFFLPILGPYLYDKFGWNIGELYTFNLNSKDFYTLWITLFGAIGAVYTIFHNRRQARDNCLANNFVKSVELFASDSESTRIGGFHSLCFLAKEYPEDYKNKVFDILCGYVCSKTAEKEYREKYENETSPEIRELLELLFKYEKYEKLFGKHEARLPKCYLQEAYLQKAHLKNAKFFRGDLKRACFNKAHLEEADFKEAHLEGAEFREARLEGANFKDAHLKGAKFEKAHLEGAKFEKAHLEELEGANLEGAIYNIETSFPKDFDPKKHRMIQKSGICEAVRVAIYKLKKRKKEEIHSEYWLG